MRALLTRVGRLQRFTDGAIIQQRGEQSTGLWMIVEGRVIARRYAVNGTTIVYAVLGTGDLFGEVACFTGEPRQVDAEADGDAVLIWIDRARVDRLIDEEPAFARWLLQSLAHQVRNALDRIDDDLTLPADTRIARLLVSMTRHDGTILHVTQQELADFVRTSRVTAGQALGRLAKAGLIALSYRRIVVTDEAGLAVRAAQRPT